MALEQSNMEEFLNGLVALCNKTRIGIILNISQIGEIPDGKFIDYFARDDEMNVVPILTDIDLDSMIKLDDDQ